MHYTPKVTPADVKYATEEVDGLKVAYREVGKPGNPKLVLLHGFPSSSHQYRNLISALADRFHVISPDYPGFGNSDAPDPSKFAYTFVQDYGGPVGFRIVTKTPDVLQLLIIQNTNAYELGFTQAWGGLRDALWHNRTPENEDAVAGLLAYDTVKAIYLHGATKPELISPDNWNSDFFTTIQKPNGRQIQLDLFFDYRTNVALIQSGSRSSKRSSRRRSSSGDKTTSSSRGKAARPTWKYCRRQRCIDWMPGTSPSKTAWSTSRSTSISSTISRLRDHKVSARRYTC